MPDEREAAHIALGISGTALAGDRREAQETLAFCARLQGLGLGVAADVADDRELAISGRALGVDDTLGDSFAVEVGVPLEELPVLH